METEIISYIISITEDRYRGKVCRVVDHCFNNDNENYYWTRYDLFAKYCKDSVRGTINGEFKNKNTDETVLKFQLYHGTLKCITLRNTFNYLKFKDIGNFIDWILEPMRYIPEFNIDKSNVNIVFEKQ